MFKEFRNENFFYFLLYNMYIIYTYIIYTYYIRGKAKIQINLHLLQIIKRLKITFRDAHFPIANTSQCKLGPAFVKFQNYDTGCWSFAVYKR